MDFSKHDAILNELLDEEFQNEIQKIPTFPSPFEDLKCSICYNLYQTPIILPKCKHMFCKECLDVWVGKQQKNCPLCRDDIQTYLDVISNETKFNLIDYNTIFYINNLEIKCQNCNWIGKVKDQQIHLDKYCKQQQCQYCKESFSQLEYENHYNSCNKRIIQCPQYCGEEIQACNIFEHYKNCIYSYQQCIKCNGIIQNIKMISHQCYNIFKPCRNEIFGCKKQEIQHECEYEFNFCQGCQQYIMKKNIKKHKCLVKKNLSELIQEYKNLVVERLNPFKHNLQLLENEKLNCSKESLLLMNVSTQIQNIENILLTFGPIYNIKQYLDLSTTNQKKISVRFYHKSQAECCSQTLEILKIKPSQLFTKQQLSTLCLIADNCNTIEKGQILEQFKDYQIENALFVSSQTDWKKGKMYYTFLLLFKNSQAAKQCQLKNPSYKFYKEYQQGQKPKYNLDPYNDQ